MPFSFEPQGGGDYGPAIAGAIGGGLQGLVDAHKWQKEQDTRNRAITSREDYERVKEEVRQMIAGMNVGEKHFEWTNPSANTTANNESKEKRHLWSAEEMAKNLDAKFHFERWKWETPSGNVLTQTSEKAREHNTPSGTAVLQTREKAREWNTPSANTKLHIDFLGRELSTDDATRRRDQDIRFDLGDRRLGLDTTRTQNTLALRTERNAIMRNRPSPWNLKFGQPAGVSPTPVTPYQPGGGGEVPPVNPQATAPSPTPERAANPFQFSFQQPSATPVTPAAGPVAPAAPTPSPTPVTPIKPGGGGGGGTDMAQLEATATAKLAQYKTETNPARKQALAAELIALRKQQRQLLAGGSGGDDE